LPSVPGWDRIAADFRESRRVAVLKKILVLSLLAAGLVSPLRPQVLAPEGDQHPAATVWKVITTPHFRIIVPAEIALRGQVVADLLERAQTPLSKTLEIAPRPISLVLTSQGIVSNGYVRLAPRMSEWFMTPPQSGFGGAADWPTLLTVHEGRHVVQFEKLDQGPTRFASYLFGDLGRAALTLLSTPMWFLEGDAVATETALSGAGRGRQPEFDMAIRALLLSSRVYPFDKAYLGSYKDWYPDYYHLGYLLTAHLRSRLGAEIWSRVLDRTARNSLRSFPFEWALTKETQRTEAVLYEEAMAELSTRWKRQLDGLRLSRPQTLNPRRSGLWTNYILPQSQPDGSVICQKYGLDESPALVRIGPDGREELLRRFSPLELSATRASARAGKIAWCEVEPDPRWGKREFGVIVLHDLRTGRSLRLTRGTRYLNAVLSPDGKRLAAVEFTEDGRSRVVILETGTGRRLKILANPDNACLMTPAWSEDGRRIALVRQGARGRGIVVLDPETGSAETALADGPEALTDPALSGRYLYYHSPYSGIDNIYALEMETGRRWQVTSVRFGAFHPEISAGGDRLYFSDYTADGFDLAILPLDPADWTRIEDVKARNVGFAERLAAEEQGDNILRLEPAQAVEYPLADYSPSAHLFNIHSWGLIPTLTEAGLLFLSNDILNKAEFQGGLTWNYDEHTFGAGFSASCRAFFPVFEFDAGYGGRRTTLEDEQGRTFSHFWREASIRTGIRFPLNLSRSVWATYLEFGMDVSLKRTRGSASEGELFQSEGTIFPLSYNFDFSRTHQASSRDLRPPYGQFLTLTYRHTPFQSGAYGGELLSVSTGAYLPGAARHHSLRLAVAYEEQDPAPYRFKSEFRFPRGYDPVFHRNLAKMSVDYALPLAYPDLALGRSLYLKRLSLNLFFDYGLSSDPGRRVFYRSAGFDVLADVNLFRLPVTINLGLRLAYRFTDRGLRIEPLVLGIAL